MSDLLDAFLNPAVDIPGLDVVAPHAHSFAEQIGVKPGSVPREGYEHMGEWELVGPIKNKLQPVVDHLDALNGPMYRKKTLTGLSDAEREAHPQAIEDFIKTGKGKGLTAQIDLNEFEELRQKAQRDLIVRHDELREEARVANKSPEQIKVLEERLSKQQAKFKEKYDAAERLITEKRPLIKDATGVEAPVKSAGTTAASVATGAGAASAEEIKMTMGSISKGEAVTAGAYERLGFLGRNVTAPIKANFGMPNNKLWQFGRATVALVGVYPTIKGLEKLGQWTGIVSAGVDPETQQPVQVDGGTAAQGLGLTALGGLIIYSALAYGGKANAIKGFTKA